jgi:signal transduction histidine kinase
MKSRAAAVARDKVPAGPAPMAGLDAMAQSGQPLLLLGAGRRLLWSNRAADRLFDLPAGGLAGRRAEEVIQRSREWLDRLLRSVTAGRQSSGTLPLLVRGGRSRSARFKAVALGHGLGLLVLQARAGISPRRALPPAPRTSPTGRIAAAIAHQIRTPLAVALMYMRFVEEEVGSRVEGHLRDGLIGARDELVRLDRLLANLVDYYHVGHLVVCPHRVDAGDVVTEAVRRARRDPTAAEVHLDVVAADLVDWWDANALEQIVQNLLSNAFKHGEGHPVWITVDRIEHSLRIRVRDGGDGIPAGARARIFRRRLAAPKARAPGLGLGLWLVRELAEAHGGDAAIESPSGEGTTFVVTISPQPPRSSADPSVQPPSPASG